MQKQTLLSLLAIFSCASVCAQEPDYRLGKVSLGRAPHGALRQGPRRRCSHPLRGQFLNYQFTSTITLVQEYRAVGCEDVTTVEIRLAGKWANGSRGGTPLFFRAGCRLFPRQDDHDARAFGVLRVDADFAAQVADDQAAEVKSQSVALAERVEFGEPLECLVVFLGRDSAAGVRHGDIHALVAFAAAFEADMAFPGEFICVAEQCREQDAEVFLARYHGDRFGGNAVGVGHAGLRAADLHGAQLRAATARRG